MTQTDTIAVVCENCSRKLKAEPKLAGKTVKCPGCQGRITVPLPPTEAVADVLEVVPESSGSTVDRLRNIGKIDVSSLGSEVRGNVFCPYCDALVSENVRILNQVMPCKSCGGQLRASRRSHERRTIYGFVLFLAMVVPVASSLAFLPNEVTIGLAIGCVIGWKYALDFIAPDRRDHQFGIPATDRGGGWWFFFWWRTEE